MRFLKLTRLSPIFLSRPIAHRGLHKRVAGVIENSQSAFEAAALSGFPIECDLQCSSDHMPVVFHDERLDRLTNEKGFVNQLTQVALTQIKIKGSEDTIQTLAELFTQIDGRVPLLIEVKDQSGCLGPETSGWLEQIAIDVQSYKGAVALMSFNPHQIEVLRRLLPDIALGLVTDNFQTSEWDYVPKERLERLNNIAEIPGLDYDFVSHNFEDLDRVAKLSCPKLCWTIKTEKAWARAQSHSDNITFEQFLPHFS